MQPPETAGGTPNYAFNYLKINNGSVKGSGITKSHS